MADNKNIAERLRQVHTLMLLAGENRFRAIAFDRAAQTIEGLSEPVDHYLESGTLTDLKGIGSSIAEDIRLFSETGSMPVLEDLKERVPDGLIRWLDISGLGPKNIVKIHKELGITEVEELADACRDGRVAALPGLGEKSAEKILKSIEWLQQHSQRCLISEAREVALPLLEVLKEAGGVQQIEVAGSLRRWNETIGDVDLLVAADEVDNSAIFDRFTGHEMVVEVLGRGETKSSIRTESGRQVDLRIVNPEQFPAALVYFTGSKEHNIVLRRRARERGMVLNEYGLFPANQDGDADSSRPMELSSETELYRHLDLAWIPPELREGRGEVEYFESHEEMPLVTPEEVRGVVHLHTTWSDGKQTVEQMARASIERGYTYMGVTDHSRSAAYAGGLSIDEVKKQWDEIDRVIEKFSSEGIEFTIFKGIESDILADGSLDYPDDLLDGFDFVIASIHHGMDMPREKMMDRFRKAIEHPAVRMIGHPTGRLLLRRGESDLDMNQLIEWAAEHQTAIEINANPHRLDLDWRHGNKALEAGLLTSINPDAHNVEGIDDILYGVMIARKAKFDSSRIVNCLTAEEFRRWARGEEVEVKE